MNLAAFVIIWSLQFIISPLDGNFQTIRELCAEQQGHIFEIPDISVRFHDKPWIKQTIYNCMVPREIYCKTNADHPSCEETE